MEGVTAFTKPLTFGRRDARPNALAWGRIKLPFLSGSCLHLQED